MLLVINGPEGRMAAKEAIVVRRKEISLLLVRGVTQEVMAKQFGVTQRQIAEDVKRIRLSNKKFLERDGADGLLGELLSHQWPRRKMLWEIVDSETASNRERISALKALGEEDDRLMRIGLAAGLMPIDKQAADTAQTNQGDIFQNLNPRIMQMVGMALDENVDEQAADAAQMNQSLMPSNINPRILQLVRMKLYGNADKPVAENSGATK